MSQGTTVVVAGRKAPTLRTKTGCFSCMSPFLDPSPSLIPPTPLIPVSSLLTISSAGAGRRRRKKCDETRPVCKRCLASNTACHWPTPGELLDRRNNALRRNSSESDDQVTVCHASVATAHHLISEELEPVLVRHFIEKFYPLMHNPASQSAIHSAMVDQINHSVRNHKGARYAILANAASHLYLVDNVTQMQERALQYYSRSLQGLANAVARPEWIDDVEEILMAIILLYLHGLIGSGVYADVPYHVNAAIRIIQYRFKQDPAGSISHGPKRMAVESVIFSSFTYAMDVWTAPINPNFTIDHAFWRECEARLAKSVSETSSETGWNGPILGTPIILLKLFLSLKQLFSGGVERSKAVQIRLRAILAPWEAWATTDETPAQTTCTQDATRLLILGAVLLLEQLRPVPPSETALIIPDIAPKHRTKSPAVDNILSVLRRRKGDTIWLRSHQGNLPVYTAGFFLRERHEIELVRTELQKRWELTNAAVVDRLRHDIEKTWKKRGLTTLVAHPKTTSKSLVQLTRTSRMDLPV